jgi:hypothetical protein
MGPIVNHPLPAGIVNINEARKVVSVRGHSRHAPSEKTQMGSRRSRRVCTCARERASSLSSSISLERDNTALEEGANGISSRRVFRTKQLGGDLAWFDTIMWNRAGSPPDVSLGSAPSWGRTQNGGTNGPGVFDL